MRTGSLGSEIVWRFTVNKRDFRVGISSGGRKVHRTCVES